MNYNSNTFVISTGEHLAAIAFSAPWVNGQPMNHGQACMVFAAVHEEVFNELFAWANIDNTVQKVLSTIYNGVKILEPSHPKHWVYQGNSWVRISESAPLGPGKHLVRLPPRSNLPRTPDPSAVYQVPGGQHYVDWLTGFVNVTLHNLACYLRNELNRYLGSMKDYEWWFEYSGNGVVYSRQNKATINYVNPVELVTEADHVNFEIGLMPRMPQKTKQMLVINADAHEAEGLEAERHLRDLLAKVPDMLMQYYSMLAQAGRTEGDVMIKYRSHAVLSHVEETIRQINTSLPIRFNLISEKQQEHQIITQHAVNSMERNLERRSIEVINKQQNHIANTLIETRNKIIKRKRVTELDQKVIASVAPDVFKETYLHDDLRQSIMDPSTWYKFDGINPAELPEPVVVTCLLISNYVDNLIGNGTTHRLPVYEGRKPAETLLSAIPLYTN